MTYSALGSSKSLEMVGGEYSKTFTVDVPDNEAPQKDNTIFINITGVTGGENLIQVLEGMVRGSLRKHGNRYVIR